VTRDRFFKLMSRRYPGIQLRDFRITWTKLTPHGSHSWSQMRGGPCRVVVSGTPGLWRINSGHQVFHSNEQAQEFAEEEAYSSLWDLMCNILQSSQHHVSPFREPFKSARSGMGISKTETHMSFGESMAKYQAENLRQ
jgi:hypothetical protein